MLAWLTFGLRERDVTKNIASFLLIVCALALGIVSSDEIERIALPIAVIALLLHLGVRPLDQSDWQFAGALLFPFIIFYFAALYNSDSYSHIHTPWSKQEYWFRIGTHCAVLAFGILSVFRWQPVARFALPFAILLLFLFLTRDKFDQDLVPGSPEFCRLNGGDGLPFSPALVISCFSLLYFALAPTLGRFAVGLSGFCLFCAVVVVLGYTASRGVFVGLLAGCMIFGIALLAYRNGQWLRRLILIGVAILGGGLASAVIDITFGCNGVSRFQALVSQYRGPVQEQTSVQTVPDEQAHETSVVTSPTALPLPVNPAEQAPLQATVPLEADSHDLNAAEEAERPDGSDSSISLRVAYWKLAWDSVSTTPLVGTGIASEAALLSGAEHNHAHQQYLSWLIWMGLPGVLAGLVGLLSPLVALRWVPAGQERAMICGVICSVLPVTLLFDSLMRLEQYIVFQTMFAALSYTIIKDTYEAKR